MNYTVFEKERMIQGQKERMASYYFTFYSTAKMQPIQISVLNGVAFGGGFGISVNGPFRIATEKT